MFEGGTEVKILSKIKPPLTDSNDGICHSAVAASIWTNWVELETFTFYLEMMHQIKGHQ